MNMDVRQLNADGLKLFRDWLVQGTGDDPPPELLSGEAVTEQCLNLAVDPTKKFNSRFEFGGYLAQVFEKQELGLLMAPDFDGMWAWIAVAFFPQLRKKNKKTGRFQGAEHFIVEREGIKGSLAYRQGPRTAYELFAVHGDAAIICLAKPMDTFGDMAEQLASRIYLARNRGFMAAAAKLYVRDGSVVRGASSYPVKPTKRKAGDKKGYGGLRRLEQRLSKLELTYDAGALTAGEIVGLLPREFDRFKPLA
jgi:hypothetical protein